MRGVKMGVKMGVKNEGRGDREGRGEGARAGRGTVTTAGCEKWRGAIKTSGVWRVGRRGARARRAHPGEDVTNVTDV